MENLFKMGTKYQFVFQFCTILVLVQCEIVDKCSSKDTCHDCIQLKDCTWCSDPNYGAPNRCFNAISHMAITNCEARYIEIVKNQETWISNRTVTKKSQPINGKIVQMRPQKMKLELRVDHPLTFKIQYTQSADYPVDLYFLMDLSSTMKNDKHKLSELGNTLGTEMQKISKDFHLGFGSFVDKTILPFTGKSSKNNAQPYGFRNQMPLTSNMDDFSKSVEKAEISNNIDTPEGSFDALMQAIVCKKEIGWRTQSRKIIILATDAGFHQALDGRLAGIIIPNDGKCHSENGTYTHSTIQDYPSIPQINLKAKENSMNIIFAVTSGVVNIYEKLTKLISGSYVAQLTDDSSNIVALIKEQYKKISTTIQLKDNAGDGIKMKYESKCLDHNVVMNTQQCEKVPLGESVEFNVTVTVTSCPKDPKEWVQNITISPVGVDEKLEIELHFKCTCDCEKSNAIIKSGLCNNNGKMICGLCQCDDGFIGSKCECSANYDVNQNATELSKQCEQDGNICNGRGECDCGLCKCNENHIKGKYCQCDDTSCERNGLGLLCSGPEQGTCDCGVCQCKEGWKGSGCSCKTGTDSCRRSLDEEICSGRGVCQCGKCKCNTSEVRYDGTFCEKCPTCADICPKLRDCVECQIYKTGKLANDCKRVCISFNTTGHVNLTAFENNEDFRMCTFYDLNGCRFRFVYNDDIGEGLKIHAQNTLECKPKIKLENVLYISITSIVLVGILTLLLWKIITTIHDRKEYAKFLKEKEKWNPVQNPLFNPATKTSTNPTFGMKE